MPGVMMPFAEADNITRGCGDNRTRLYAQLEDVVQLFHSVLPDGQAVPALIFVFVLLTLLSFLINVPNLFCVGRSDDISCQPRFVLFNNLILTNLIQTVIIGPAVIHSLVKRRTMAISLWCYVQIFLGAVSVFSSVITITCMVLERYLYVCHVLQYQILLSEKRLRQLLTLIWVYSVFIAIIIMTPLLHNQRKQKNGPVTMGLLCDLDIMEGYPRALVIFHKVVGSITLLLCLLAHAFSYYRMYRTGRMLRMPFKADSDKARKTVLFYCGMLFVQLLPLLFKVSSNALWEFQDNSMFDLSYCKLKLTPTAAALHVALLIILLVPPCINPLVFGVRNVEMRQTLTNLFQWPAEDRVVEIRQALTNLFRWRADNRVELPLERIRVRYIVDQNQKHRCQKWSYGFTKMQISSKISCRFHA
ncbi:olfactory receptor 8K1 [Odontesthes bonariensis]|uniref:olfactory receptor 8K1 n=1 Tax=Odontesthes bonariensis TaxID=219752 RepID=UPI003F5807C5